MSDQTRRPAGAPDGGQFATTEGAESEAALTEAGKTARDARRAMFAARKASSTLAKAVELHIMRSTGQSVDIAKFSEDHEMIEIGQSPRADPRPGTVEALASIDTKIQYADDDTFGYPGWETTADGVTIRVLDDSTFTLHYPTAPAGGVLIEFTGVPDVRTALREITDTAHAAQADFEYREDETAGRYPNPPWR